MKIYQKYKLSFLKKRILLLLLCSLVFIVYSKAQSQALKNYDITWDSQSKNSGASMPCGGGSVGLNVWVEKGDILFYMARSGTFDENNALLKLGRVRIKFSPNPFAGTHFSQTLHLKDGSIYIQGKYHGIEAKVHLWVDVFNP